MTPLYYSSPIRDKPQIQKMARLEMTGFRGLGCRGLGFRGLGFRGLGFRGQGHEVRPMQRAEAAIPPRSM